MDDEQVKGIRTINDAMTLVVADLEQRFDPNKRHVLVTHFTVTANTETKLDLTSETTSKVGGLATLNTTRFDAFDYVMLGHIHTRLASPDQDKMRYAGSPVKFNVKEANPRFHGKGVDIVDITPTAITRTFHPITPQTDLVVLTATWETLLDPNFYNQQPTQRAWFAITVKDFDRSRNLNVRAQLQKIYGTIVELDYVDQAPTTTATAKLTNQADLSPEATVDQFFNSITGKPLSEPQRNLVDDIFVEIGKEAEH